MPVAVRIHDAPASVSLAEYIMTSIDEVQDLPTATKKGANGEPTCAVGSVAYTSDHAHTFKLGPDDAWHETVSSGSGGGGSQDVPPATKTTRGTVIVGDGLSVNAAGKISVETANAVEEGNMLPVTSAAVYAEIGNINALLASI